MFACSTLSRTPGSRRCPLSTLTCLRVDGEGQLGPVQRLDVGEGELLQAGDAALLPPVQQLQAQHSVATCYKLLQWWFTLNLVNVCLSGEGFGRLRLPGGVALVETLLRDRGGAQRGQGGQAGVRAGGGQQPRQHGLAVARGHHVGHPGPDTSNIVHWNIQSIYAPRLRILVNDPIFPINEVDYGKYKNIW